jgi:hypothetical protein
VRENLVRALGPIPADVARPLVNEFVAIRRDAALGMVGHAAPGRFVEGIVQALQFLTTGSYDPVPAVTRTLRGMESQQSLDDALRCVVHVARTMYVFRNKRGVAHKNAVEANLNDLQYLFSGAQWILGELVRRQSGHTSDDAGRLVRQIILPVAGLVEEIGGRRIVLARLPVRDEVLVVLYSYYPEPVTQRQVLDSVDRIRTDTVLNALDWLWKQKLVDGGKESGYTLTHTGVRKADGIVLAMTA